MIPRAEWVLADLARVLMEEVVPHTAAYQQAVLTDAAVMLGAAAAAWDGAAQILVDENRRLRRLFYEAATVVTDTKLAASLRAEASGRDENFRVSALQEANETLRQILIKLHEAIETMPEENTHGIEAAIWRELAEATFQRRTPYDAF